MVKVITIFPLETLSRSAPSATFNTINPSCVVVESVTEPKVIPFGNNPTAAVVATFDVPKYPTKGISINICSGTMPELSHGIF